MRESEWCKHCDEYKIEVEMKLNREEAEIIKNLFESEWVCFLDKKEEDLLDKLYKFLEVRNDKDYR